MEYLVDNKCVKTVIEIADFNIVYDEMVTKITKGIIQLLHIPANRYAVMACTKL